MEVLHQLVIFISHLDQQLVTLVTTYGSWTYLFLFFIIFCEAALIFIAFLPGDSILFAAGALSASADNILNIHLLFLLLVIASVLGNGVGYFIGKWLGPKIFEANRGWRINKKYLDKTHLFYERYGGKAIIIARFIPIIRTAAPFIAGFGYLTYRRFFIYNLIGCVAWSLLLLYGSYWFGNIPFVKHHFYLIIAAIIILSLTPVLIGIFRQQHTHINKSS